MHFTTKDLNLADETLFKVSANIAEFKAPTRAAIDSLRFITTENFIFKLEAFLRNLNLKLSETAFNPRHLTLADYYGYKTPKTAQICKIGAKCNIYTYTTSESLETARNAKRALTHFRALEIHGLAQYDSGGEPLELDKQAQKIIKYLMRFCGQDKERAALRLASFDYALDYEESGEISREYALAHAPFLAMMGAKFRQYAATTLYIQTEHRERGRGVRFSPINPPLLKTTIYDKAKKNALQKPLKRFELCFSLS